MLKIDSDSVDASFCAIFEVRTTNLGAPSGLSGLVVGVAVGCI